MWRLNRAEDVGAVSCGRRHEPHEGQHFSLSDVAT